MMTAELSVVLAGFSGVVISLQRRFEDPNAMAYSRLWRLVETSLSSALFSIVPLVLHSLGLAESTVWSAASLMFAVYLVSLHIYFFRRFWELWRSSEVSWRFNGPTLSVQALLVVGLVFNALGARPHAAPYFLAVVWYVVLSGLVFARLLLIRGDR